MAGPEKVVILSAVLWCSAFVCVFLGGRLNSFPLAFVGVGAAYLAVRDGPAIAGDARRAGALALRLWKKLREGTA